MYPNPNFELLATYLANGVKMGVCHFKAHAQSIKKSSDASG